MIKLELDHKDQINLFFCLLYTKDIINNNKYPMKEYRENLIKWIDLMVEDMKIQGEYNEI